MAPFDHGPGDAMYDRSIAKPRATSAARRVLPPTIDPAHPMRSIGFITENGSPDAINFFRRGLDIRVPSSEAHDCGPYCGMPRVYRPYCPQVEGRTSAERNGVQVLCRGGHSAAYGGVRVADDILKKRSPWTTTRTGGKQVELITLRRPLQLFWAGRASGRKGFRGDLYRFHTDAATNTLPGGWLLRDTSGKHTPSSAAADAFYSTRGGRTSPRVGWFSEAMASSDFCYSPPGAAHGDSDRYLPAVLYGCIPILVKDGEVRQPWILCDLA